MDTEGGMRHLRQAKNSDMHKRASLLNKDREEYGFQSEIVGLLADKASKLRGDRIDRLFLEESGSNPILVKTYLQGNALVEVLGKKFGTRFVWGTGGDSGPALAGLSSMFYNPEGFNILPYYHNHTRNGEYVYTSFFIPAYTFIDQPDIIDHRGVTCVEKAKDYYIQRRNLLMSSPKAYIIECAEFCFSPDDALALEGDDQFNTVLLTEQLSAIRLHKIGPKIETGRLEYTFKNNVQSEETLDKIKFVPDVNGHVRILEHPVIGEGGEVPRNLYVAGIDGIDMGQEDTSENTKNPSDFCVVVKKRAFGLDEPKIVCIYRCRSKKLRDDHMNCLKILQYYSCKAVLECTRLSTLQFFREKKQENRYLMRRPRATQTDIQNGKSKQFGSPATETIIRHQLDLIGYTIDEYCQNLWFEELLQEAITYSYENKRKFDIIAAWGMAELGDEELMGVIPRDEAKDTKQFVKFGWWTDENGYKHYGRKDENPKFESPKFNFNTRSYDDIERNRTSNPRYN